MQVLPIIYLFIGFFLFSQIGTFKIILSKVLTRFLIPAVIIINLSHNFYSSILIISIFFFAILLLFIYGNTIEGKPLNSLYYSYLNIGWLGLPLSSALLDNVQTAILLNAYIGSSIFGNTVGIYALLQGNHTINFLNLLRQPTILAVIIGFILSFLPIDIYPMVVRFENTLHILLSFCGMVVLGIWLRSSKLTKRYFAKAIRIQVFKMIGFILLSILLYFILSLLKVPNVTNIILVLIFISFLPPAANIVVLETYYMNKGDSAPIIASGTITSIVLLILLMISVPYILMWR